MHSKQVIFMMCFWWIGSVMTKDYLRVCYYTNWSVYRRGPGNFNLKAHYQTGLCTHIIYSFAKVTTVSEGGYGIVPYEAHDQTAGGGYEVLNKDLKSKDKSLKTLLAVGGWTHASEGFKQMVATKYTRAKFIENSIKYLEKYGFDGLDLDWEYPAQRGSPLGDRNRFSKLCEELKKAYKPRGLLVTAAVAAGAGSVDISYDVSRVSKALDFINLMTYDLHGSWEAKVGHHTDTNPKRPYPSQHSLYNTVNHWIRKGAAKEKLVLGLASYGRTWKLKNPCDDWNLGGQGAWTGGLPGSYTSESGFLAYYEICEKDWKQRICTRDSDAKAPYGTDGRDFIGYDDEESIVHKVNNVMIAKGLRGFMFWALDLDDFHGNCGGIKYPLITAAKNAAMGIYQSTPRCSAITTSKCVPPTTVAPAVGKNGCRLNKNGPWRNRLDIDAWCKNSLNCPNADYCGESYPGCTSCMCICEDLSATTTTTVATTTTKDSTTTTTATTTTTSTTTESPITESECTPTKRYENSKVYIKFCARNCDLCNTLHWLSNYCNCNEKVEVSTTTTTTTTTTADKTKICSARNKKYNYYCQKTCSKDRCKRNYWIRYYCFC